MNASLPTSLFIFVYSDLLAPPQVFHIIFTGLTPTWEAVSNTTCPFVEYFTQGSLSLILNWTISASSRCCSDEVATLDSDFSQPSDSQVVRGGSWEPGRGKVTVGSSSATGNTAAGEEQDRDGWASVGTSWRDGDPALDNRATYKLLHFLLVFGIPRGGVGSWFPSPLPALTTLSCWPGEWYWKTCTGETTT